MSSVKIPDRDPKSMAVAPSPNSKASVSAPTKDKKRKMLGSSGKEEEEGSKSEMKIDDSSSQPKKRNSNPGVRVIRGRVYDSENGTTCHQCRQKTYAVSANCKNKAKTKPCPLKYCNTCLLNRYGEKVEDVTLLDEWSCPKCRDACNCSICRKKRGYEPTGQLSLMAKAGGFSSVSNMLDVKGAQSVSNYKRAKATCTSPRKQVASEEGTMITSPKKKGKENIFDGNTDSSANPSLVIPSSVEENPKKSNQRKPKQEGSKDITVENGNSVAIKPKKINQKKLKLEGSNAVVGENGNSDAIKLKKSNQKKLKPDGSKETVLESGNADAVKPKKMSKKNSTLEGSKETVLESGNADAVKPKKMSKKNLTLEGSKEMILENGDVDAVKLKKVNKKKIQLEGSSEMIVENGNGGAVMPKKINQNKLKLEGSKEMIVGNGNSDAVKPKKITQKKLKLEKPKEVIGDDGNNGAILKVDGVQKKQKGIKRSIQDPNEVEKKKTVNENGEVLHGENADQCNVEENALKLSNNSFKTVIPLPPGSELVTIAGVDLPKDDVGNALQLLEFCATFGKILDVKKGQAEAVLRDLIKVRSTRRGKCSVAIQFQIQLLSVIQAESELESESESESPVSKPTHGNDSWVKGLKSCIPKSYLSEQTDCIDRKAGAYDNLDSSTKLRLLTFLCDEILGTKKIRDWMDEQNAKFAEKKKEARNKLADAREKEKSLKQKMVDDVAKAVIKRDGAPLTLLEHDAIVSKIKKEAAEAHAEILACKQMIPIDTERPNVVRTEPIFRDKNGHFYWRLKGCSEKPGILLQDIGTGDLSVETADKWSEYDSEQMALVQKHINIMRSRF